MLFTKKAKCVGNKLKGQAVKKTKPSKTLCTSRKSRSKDRTAQRHKNKTFGEKKTKGRKRC